MKKKVLSFLIFGSLLIAATPKDSKAVCVTVELTCSDIGYLSCAMHIGNAYYHALEAEYAICG